MATEATQTMPRVITSLATQNPDIRKIRLYRNGDENFYGKELVFNRKQMRDIEHLLQTVTDHVELDRAARSIHTPDGGSKVERIDDLADKGSYVIVGYGKFKKLEYDKLFDRYVTKLRDNKKRSEETGIRKPLKPVESNDWPVPGRIRNTVVDVVPIYVYRNGDDREPAKRIILTHRMMTHWSFILAEISRYVQPQYTATHYLFSLDGERVVHKKDIQAYSHYVAVGYRNPFKKLNYGQFERKPAFSVSPRLVRRRTTKGSFLSERPRDSVLSEDESLTDSNSLALMSSQSEPVTGKRRSRPNRKYMIYNDGKEVLRPYRHQQPLPSIQDSARDDGPFKAKEDRLETRDAQPVDDAKRTLTHKPRGKKEPNGITGDELYDLEWYDHRATQTHTPMHKVRHSTKKTEQNNGSYYSSTPPTKRVIVYRNRQPDDRRHDDDGRRHGKVFVGGGEMTTISVEDETLQRNAAGNNDNDQLMENEVATRASPSGTVERTEVDETVKSPRDLGDETVESPRNVGNETVNSPRDSGDETVESHRDLGDETVESARDLGDETVESPRDLEGATRSTPNEDDATGTTERKGEDEMSRRDLEDTESAARETSNVGDNTAGTVENVEDDKASETGRGLEDATNDTELVTQQSRDVVESSHREEEKNEQVDGDRDATIQRVDENDESATKIQAAFRGYQVRKQLKQPKNSEY